MFRSLYYVISQILFKIIQGHILVLKGRFGLLCKLSQNYLYFLCNYNPVYFTQTIVLNNILWEHIKF